MTPAHRFAIATREELWTSSALAETRVSHGVLEQIGTRITASDAADEELLERSEALLASLRELVKPFSGGRARVVASSRRAADVVRDEELIILKTGELSLVSDREHFAADAELLEMCGARPIVAAQSIDYRGIPILWKHGSASVLLHEAAGHAAERGARPIAWPEWLSVQDEPAFEADDAGIPPTAADLVRGEKPRAMRRASFTDVALPRMSNVVVTQSGPALTVPSRRIEVSLVSGGSYEPLTDRVALYVSAAQLVDGDSAERLPRFVIDESREIISRSLMGADGQPERYPGVICSSEGQQLLVGSRAPRMLTLF